VYLATANATDTSKAPPSVYIASLDGPDRQLLDRIHSRAVFVAPWVEEACKATVIFAIAWWRRHDFNGVIAGVVYAGLAGIGFAFTENIVYYGQIFQHVHDLGNDNGAAMGAVQSLFLWRGVAAPFIHPMFTMMTGIGIGLAVRYRNVGVRVLAPVVGYCTAVFNCALKGRGLMSSWERGAAVVGYCTPLFNCSRIPGFSNVDTSCVIVSFFANDRSNRRMIFPERVLGRFSPKRMSSGLAIAPIFFATCSRSSFRIAGVLNAEIKEGIGQGGLRGLMPSASIYLPLQLAHDWVVTHRSPMSQVALALARRGGNLGGDQTEGYDLAIVRVEDPVKLTAVRQKISDLGFGSFSIVDEIDQIRTVFLIIDSVLGLLGGISLLVASFGIANTMIMSILERTREIGIMKAIGAEDREIKLIFFVEAAVIGVVGGVIGVLLAWGIDALANRLAYRFILKPQGASFIDFFDLPIYLTVGAILFALVVSILAALYPASRAARIDPVRALRHD